MFTKNAFQNLVKQCIAEIIVEDSQLESISNKCSKCKGEGGYFTNIKNGSQSNQHWVACDIPGCHRGIMNSDENSLYMLFGTTEMGKLMRSDLEKIANPSNKYSLNLQNLARAELENRSPEDRYPRLEEVNLESILKECTLEVLKESLMEGFDPLSQGPNPSVGDENPYPAWNAHMRQLEEDDAPSPAPESVSDKTINVIKSWQEKLKNNRAVGVKIIDAFMNQRVGLSSADLPDTSTFAGGLDGVEEALDQNDYNGAVQIAKDTVQEMLEDEGFGMDESQGGMSIQHDYQGDINKMRKMENNHFHGRYARQAGAMDLNLKEEDRSYRQELINQISDDYKSIYGSRPRFLGDKSIAELKQFAKELSDEINSDIEREKQDNITHSKAVATAMTQKPLGTGIDLSKFKS